MCVLGGGGVLVNPFSIQLYRFLCLGLPIVQPILFILKMLSPFMSSANNQVFKSYEPRSGSILFEVNESMVLMA